MHIDMGFRGHELWSYSIVSARAAFPFTAVADQHKWPSAPKFMVTKETDGDSGLHSTQWFSQRFIL
jgi:hypothetical protein